MHLLKILSKLIQRHLLTHLMSLSLTNEFWHQVIPRLSEFQGDNEPCDINGSGYWYR